jgi:hypothetical protein
MPGPLNVSKHHDIRLNLKLAGMFFGKRGFFGSPRVDVNETTATGVLLSQNLEGQMMDTAVLNGGSQEVVDARPFLANDDEWKDRIPKHGRTRIQRIIRWIVARYKLLRLMRNPDLSWRIRWDMLLLGRELISTELSEINEHETRKRLDDFHKGRSRYGEKLLIETLARMGYCNRVVNEANGRRSEERRVGKECDR